MDIITYGLELDLKQSQTQNSRPTYPLSSNENQIISVEIKILLKKSVIAYSTPGEDEFIFLFIRDKKYGNKRMILNLKKFNKFFYYKHFKMESIKNFINLIKPNVYMASISLSIYPQ